MASTHSNWHPPTTFTDSSVRNTAGGPRSVPAPPAPALDPRPPPSQPAMFHGFLDPYRSAQRPSGQSTGAAPSSSGYGGYARQDIQVPAVGGGYNATTFSGDGEDAEEDDDDDDDDDDDGEGEEDESEPAEPHKGKKRAASTAGGNPKSKQARADSSRSPASKSAFAIGKGSPSSGPPGSGLSGTATAGTPSAGVDGHPAKVKSTRGSRACTVCRRLKMRCVGAEDGPPCKRCKSGGHDCLFEESQRGKRSTKRTDVLARNLKTMEEKLDLVMSKMHSQPPTTPPLGILAPASVPSGLPSAHLHLPLGSSVSSEQAPTAWSNPAHALAPPGPTPPSVSSMLGVMSSLPHTHVAPPGHPEAVSRPSHLSHAEPQHPSARFPAPVPALSRGVDGGGGGGGGNSSGKGHTRFAEGTVGGESEGHGGTGSGSGSRPSSPRLHSLPDNTLNPLGLLAEASLHNRHRRSPMHRHNGSPGDQQPLRVTGGSSDDGASSDGHPGLPHPRRVGVANQAYFQPGPMNILPLRRIVIEQRMPPSLLADKVLSSEEAVELFQLYFERCNPHCCILEPEMHTPTLVGSRSPFLFTAVCAVASKYYLKRRDLYFKCLSAAKRCAFEVLVKGYKSVEIVQALLLLSLWNQPAERFEEDRTWAFSGIAIRMATDLNLHRKTTAKLAPNFDDFVAVQYEREILNRERTWMYCFIIDRALSAQMGKPYTIREDWLIRNCKSWSSQRCSVPADFGLVAMTDLHRKFARILDTLHSDASTVSGINNNLDYSVLMRTFTATLDAWSIEWENGAAGGSEDQPGGYRSSMREFFYNYYRLFTMSFMLQHAMKKPDKVDLPQAYALCHDAAVRVIMVSRDYLGPLGALRFAPDSQFVYIAYAAVFLLKLIRPEFRVYSDQHAMLNLVHEVIVLFESIAVDETHTPALYATFLRVLLTAKQASAAPSRAEPRSSTEPAPAMASQQPTPEQIETALRRSGMGAEADGAGDGQGVGDGEGRPNGARAVGDQTLPAPGPGQAAGQGNGVDPAAGHMEVEQGAGDMDHLLRDGRFMDGFWESMLMPGYSGPLDALSGGTGLVSHFQNGGEALGGFGFTPAASGRTTPTQLFAQSSLDLGNIDYGGGGGLHTPHLRNASVEGLGTPHLAPH